MIKLRVKKLISFILSVVLTFSVVVITSSAAEDVAGEIFCYLVEDMNLTPAAACGVLANIEYESDFDYMLYGDGGTSFGICQWHNERWDNMIDFCNRNKLSWKSLDGQLAFLNYELTNYGCDTGYILSKLVDIENTADGAYEAAYKWCYYFERPANREYQSDKRGTRAKNYYWPKYGQNYKTKNPTTGDLNSDGVINSTDSLLLLKYTVGAQNLDSNQLRRADINSDNLVNSQDALILLKVAVGTDSISNYK